jgi:hypothetical protein
LQDKGVPDPKSEQGKLKFPKLKTMSGKIYKQLNDCKAPQSRWVAYQQATRK